MSQHIQIKPSDVELAKGSTFLDDMDMIQSPHNGRLVPVAMKNGVHVCWQCGEPFEPERRELALVEKRPEGSEVAVGVHRKCVNGPAKRFFHVTQGLGIRRGIAEIVKKTSHIFGK